VPPLAAKITEHRAHGRLCPCGRITYASIPPEVGRHCFGPRLTALVGYLSARCHDSKRVIREVLADVLGVPISLGTVTAREQEVRKALHRPYAQAQRHVRLAAVKHVDETTWASRGQPRWLWVAATDKAALYRVHRRRTAKALGRLLGTKQIGTIVTDRHGAYSHWPASRRQVCWAHLKRDFTRWRERGTGLGRTGLSVCRQVFALWRDFRQGTLTAVLLTRLIEPVKKRLRRVLVWWREQGSDDPAYAFARNLLSVHAALWTFATPQGIALGVEPTNNHAERMLRPAVLWRKVSFGSQGQNGCHFAERVLTAVHTLRLQGRDVLDYLTESVANLRAGTRAPRLIAR
jgi:transposase